MNSVEFLLNIFRIQCREGEHICLSTKDGSSWKDYSYPFDSHLEQNLTDWFDRHSQKDLYFCPLPFSQPKRRKEFVTRSQFLWSDIDAADPNKCLPTILWRSSPGRHQGLWKLPRPVTPQEAEDGSKNLAYYLGADKGGWDLTQVLRPIGTPNNKYPEKPLVTLIHSNNSILKKIPQRPLDRWRKSIPSKLLRIIEGPAEIGRRSDILWSCWHELLDLGIPIRDVEGILRDSNHNKYRGRSDEDERFASEVQKIVEDRTEKKLEVSNQTLILSVETYSDLMGKIPTHPGWMVEHWWQRASHGILAGQPKSFKSTIAMDMFFSVASAKPFLDQFKVPNPGPVLIVQNENSDHIMKDRWEKISTSKGEIGKAIFKGRIVRVEWARDLPIFMVNQSGFTLDSLANRAALEELIQRLKPVAIQLDPLYLLFSGDVNSAQDLNSVLVWCLYIKQTYNCTIMLVHHYSKGNGENKRSGQKMLGSTTLHGWVESALYVEVQEPQGNTAVITLDREFRGAGGYEKVDLHITQGEYGVPEYSARLVEHKTTEADFEEQIIGVLMGSTDLLSKSSIAKAVGISRRQADKVIDAMVSKCLMTRVGERYGVAS